jgi:hypothetical protein
MGVSTPSAAAVAEATVGLAMLLHTLGAAPKLHCSIAPEQTHSDMPSLPYRLFGKQARIHPNVRPIQPCTENN